MLQPFKIQQKKFTIWKKLGKNYNYSQRHSTAKGFIVLKEKLFMEMRFTREFVKGNYKYVVYI